MKKINVDWEGSTLGTESTLHQLSPFIGKMKSSMASSLIREFTKEGDIIFDPFAGSGTVALESWILNRHVIANDLSPYSHVLTNGKLFPYATYETAIDSISKLKVKVDREIKLVDLRKIDKGVRAFFHKQTLRELMAWFNVLHRNNEYFILACLLGILHHQRPGFLSYPSSHTVPYLRSKIFPREQFPELYEYRNVESRLLKKIQRAYKRVPSLDSDIKRKVLQKDVLSLDVNERIDAIITSPPYMRKLAYARDNRLRLWFLGTKDWKLLDKVTSPREEEFLSMMRICLLKWYDILKKDGLCILVLGDSYSKRYKTLLPDMVKDIAITELGKYSILGFEANVIPMIRRVRRGLTGNKKEYILVLQKS